MMDGHSSDFLLESSPGFESLPATSSSRQTQDGIEILVIQGSEYRPFPPVPEQQNAFLAWWRTTTIAGSYEQKKITMAWGSRVRRSSVWSKVQEITEEHTGLPKVHCKKCRRLFAHPSASQHGTHSLNRHLQRCTSNDETNQPSKRIMDYVQGQSVCLHQIKNKFQLLITQ